MSSYHSSWWHDLLRYSHVWGYLLKWPLYFVGGWGAIYYRRWRQGRREAGALGWPSVEGIIVKAEMNEIPKTTRYHVTLQYTYFVEEYRIGTYQHDFAGADEAGEFVRQMKDKRVQIRYKESNPDKSVLEQRTVEQFVMMTPRFG